MVAHRKIQPRQNWWRQGRAEAVSSQVSWQMGQLLSVPVAIPGLCNTLGTAEDQERTPRWRHTLQEGEAMVTGSARERNER